MKACSSPWTQYFFGFFLICSNLIIRKIFLLYFQVGNSEKVHLPLETEVPPPRSVSQTSFTSDYDDSDEDFIVFEKVSASFIS
jgi:hypothetical protein